MALLLCGKRARSPFCFEKLNLRFYSLEEIVYCIRRYPLIAVDGLAGEGLIQWLREEEVSPPLAGDLEKEIAAGTGRENLLLKIVQSANYLTPEEIRDLGTVMLGIRRMKPRERAEETGKMYLEAGRYQSAYEKFAEALKLLDREPVPEGDELEQDIRRADRAELLCDMAAVSMLRFDPQNALRLLEEADRAGRFKRAEVYRYLITGESQLSREEQEELTDRKRRLEMKIRGSSKVKKIMELSAGDYAAFSSFAGATLEEWKREYRRMV